MRKLRGLVADRLVEVTTRTFQGRFLLRPSREVNRTILGVLGRGQRLTEIDICGFAFLSNHYHMLVVPESTKQLSSFMGFVNGNIARKLGPLQGWRGRLWERRYQHIVVSGEPEAQIGRLSYLLCQGVKEGLVRHPADWPGVHCVRHLLNDDSEVKGGCWHDQTAEGRARRSGKPFSRKDFLHDERVLLSPVPVFADWTEADRRWQIRDLVTRIEEIGRRRREETGRAPLGRKRILLQVPSFRPERVKRSPAPAFHASSGAHYRQLQEAYWAFLAEFREASRQLKEGFSGVLFPPGCFPPRLPYVPESRAGP